MRENVCFTPIRIASLGLVVLTLLASPVAASGPIDDRGVDVRKELARALKTNADERQIAIDTEGLTFLTRDDAFAVNAGIKGYKNLKLEDLKEGADVGFVYLDLPSESRLQAGFYTVRIYAGGDGSSSEGRAEFVDADGRVMLTVPAQVNVLGVRVLIPRLTVCVGYRFVQLDYHWLLFDVYVDVYF